MKCLRSANGIQLGDKFRYRSRGLYVDGIWTNRGAEYDVEVVSISTHLITLSMLIDQVTMSGPILGKPQPYNWSIRKVDVGTTEKLYLPDEN